jgi:hypothetical protein
MTNHIIIYNIKFDITYAFMYFSYFNLSLIIWKVFFLLVFDYGLFLLVMAYYAAIR